MVKLKSLTVEGFRSFADEATVEFPESGSMLISGLDTRTGGSNGSGKSSILMAISYALGYCHLPATELKNPATDSIKVVLDLIVNDVVWSIRRSGAKLSLSIGGAAVDGMKSVLQEKIDAILINPEIFGSMSYRQQDSNGLMLFLEDSKIKSFLGQCIPDLDKIETAVEDAGKKQTQIESSKNLLESQLGFVMSNLSTVNEADLELKIAVLQKELEAMKPTDISGQQLAIQSQLSAIQKEQQKIAVAESRISSMTQEGKMYYTEMTRKQSQIASLESHKCPTCTQDWIDAAKELAMVRSHVNQIRDKLTAIKVELDKAPDYTAQKADLDQQSRKLQMELGGLHQAQVQSNSSINDKRNLLRELGQKMSQYQTSKTKLSQLHTEISQLTANSKLEESIQSLLGRQGLLGHIFDELLTEIQEDCNSNMSCIPNCSDLIIEISSTSETKTGKTNTKISTRISKNGHHISIKALSGGQKAAISFCLDMALMSAIQRRTNVAPGFLCLDEPFDGMDVASKEAAIEVLKKYSGDRLIILIDHASEICESIDKFLQVEFDGRTSKISCIS